MSDSSTTQEMEPLTMVEVGMAMLIEAAKELRIDGDGRHEVARKLEDIVSRWRTAKEMEIK